MLAGNALRHQMILPEQRALFDYWRSLLDGRDMPTRDDLDPVKLKAFLPFLTIVEPGERDGQPDYKFRLAGTGFWDIYNSEITGQWLSELPEGSRRPYWSNVMGRVLETQRASAGAGAFKVPGKTHMAQFWLRLPLRDSTNDKTLILGFDKFVKKSKLARAHSQLEMISA